MFHSEGFPACAHPEIILIYDSMYLSSATIKYQLMIKLGTLFYSEKVAEKEYSSLLSFTVPDINNSVTKLIALGAELDGPIKYEIYGKVLGGTVILIYLQFIFLKLIKSC